MRLRTSLSSTYETFYSGRIDCSNVIYTLSGCCLMLKRVEEGPGRDVVGKGMLYAHVVSRVRVFGTSVGVAARPDEA